MPTREHQVPTPALPSAHRSLACEIQMSQGVDQKAPKELTLLLKRRPLFVGRNLLRPPPLFPISVFQDFSSSQGQFFSFRMSSDPLTSPLPVRRSDELAVASSPQRFVIHAARSDVVGSGACPIPHASAVRTRGATRVPSSSIARMSLACGNAATLIWNVKREMPPNDSFTRRIFSATISGSPTRSAPVGPSWASKCARVIGGQPRSLPISVKLCA